MAKQKVNVADAQKIVNQLVAKQAALAKARQNDESEMAAVSYEAHTGGCTEAKLETLQGRVIKREVEAKSLDSAILEARRRVAEAQNSEREAEQRKIAEEIIELAGVLRKLGANAEHGLKFMIENSNAIGECIAELQQRGLGNPSAQQLQSLGSRAILGAIVDSPFAKSFEHIAPRERQSFAQFTASWAAAIERAVGAKTNNKEDAA